MTRESSSSADDFSAVLSEKGFRAIPKRRRRSVCWRGFGVSMETSLIENGETFDWATALDYTQVCSERLGKHKSRQQSLYLLPPFCDKCCGMP